MWKKRSHTIIAWLGLAGSEKISSSKTNIPSWQWKEKEQENKRKAAYERFKAKQAAQAAKRRKEMEACASMVRRAFSAFLASMAQCTSTARLAHSVWACLIHDTTCELFNNPWMCVEQMGWPKFDTGVRRVSKVVSYDETE